MLVSEPGSAFILETFLRSNTRSERLSGILDLNVYYLRNVF